MVAPSNNMSTGTSDYDLTGGEGLCRCNEVKDLEMRSSWFFLTLKFKDKCPYKRKAEGDLRQTEEVETHRK